jgi:penicillin-binding protein 2
VPTKPVPTGWFVGWGPVNDPQYLIVVVIEKGGYGASAAAPVAKDGFEYLVNNPPAPVVLGPPVASAATSTTSTVPGPGSTSTTAAAH